MGGWYLSVKKLRYAVFVVCCLAAAVGAQSNDSLYALAKKRANAGRYNEALLMLERILFRDALHNDARMLEGHIYLQQNNFKKAQTTLQMVIDRDPDYRDAWVSLIHAYHLDGAQAKACSTSHKAEEYLGNSSVLQMQQKSVCTRDTVKTEKKRKKKRSAGKPVQPETVIFTKTGGSLYEKSYDPRRYPWAHMDAGVAMRCSRWGFASALHMQRRKYDEQTVLGIGIDLTPRYYFLPAFAAGLGFSWSPYFLFDSVFAEKALNVELAGDLPAGFRTEGAARFRWFGDRFSPTFSLGAQMRLWNYRLSAGMVLALSDGGGFVSGEGSFRRYSMKTDRCFTQAGIALGYSPYDRGSLITDGYAGFFEGSIVQKVHTGGRLSVLPGIAVAGEQFILDSDINNDGYSDHVVTPVRIRVTVDVTVEVNREER